MCLGLLLIHWRWTTTIYIYRERDRLSNTKVLLKKIKQAKKSFLLVRILKVNESETECEIYKKVGTFGESFSRFYFFFTLSCTWFWMSSIKGK